MILMSEQLLLTLITAFSAIAVSIVSGMFLVASSRQKRHNAVVSQKLDVVRHQVENEHSTNLRDDLDRVEQHVIENERSARAADEMILGEIRGIRRDIGRLADRDLQQAADTRALANEVAMIRQSLSIL